LDVLVDGVCAETELLLSGRHAGQALIGVDRLQGAPEARKDHPA